MKTKSPAIVHVRQRESRGTIYLYLDIIEYGNRRKESLHMHLENGKDRISKMRNLETLRIADLKARALEDELNALADGLDRKGVGLDQMFYPFFESIMNSKKKECTRNNWKNCLNHLRRYEPDETITFRDINTRWVVGFRDYLENDALTIVSRDRRYKVVDIFGKAQKVFYKHEEPQPLSLNTCRSMFNTFCGCINAAMERNWLRKNPLEGIKRFKKDTSKREHLTAQEVRTLLDTPYAEHVKNPFLFSCMTGLRWCDVKKLRWEEIKDGQGFSYIDTKMQKTGKEIQIPLNSTALSLIGNRRADNELVFPEMRGRAHVNEDIAIWCHMAGIDKMITFHCSRHTFACLTLMSSGNIYTTSKLLGHAEIKTTEIYAKVLDESKQKAVNLLNDLI